MSENGSEGDVLVAIKGSVGHLTLNRPNVINSLTLDMVRTIDAALTEWESNDQIMTVLLDGAGERGFCAGGDIRSLYDAARTGDPSARVFWREEYYLNARIARYPKPIVAIMDGIVMGGGVGLAGHASHRVATERLKTAMPEVGIGFAPDVGATYLLPRAPGELGTHLALTGDRLGAADALFSGFSDYRVDSSLLPTMVEHLRDADVDIVLGELQVPPDAAEPGRLEAASEWINACYGASTVEEILERLRARPEPEAATAAEAIESKSPTALKVALRALRTGRELPTLEACLDQEYRVSCAFLDSPDFVEGIRATIIDKDGDPRWSPDSLQHVAQAEIDRHFASLGPDELGLAA